MAEGGEPVVSLASREMVVPAKPTERHNYFLSCFDIFWQVIPYNQRVIFYDKTLLTGVSGQEAVSGHGRAVMEKLKSSLAVCLVHYYPWCGRLAHAAGDPQHRLVLDCNDAGVELVEAYVDLPISLLAKQGFQMKPFYEKLCQHVDHTGDCLYSNPLLSIQATLFSDGGLALGISQSHIVADGQSIWNFMVSWGECARGVRLSAPPVLNRELLVVPDPSPEKAATWKFLTYMSVDMMADDDIAEEEVKHTVDHALRQNYGGTCSLLPEDHPSPSVGTGSLSAEDKDINLSASGDRVGIDPSASEAAPLVPCFLTLPSSAINKLKIESGALHSSYEVTCAHLWQRLTIARQRPLSEPTSMFVFANCRSRVKPPLPPTYFVTPQVPKGKWINVASSPRFPAYDVDFGWGKPVAVRPSKFRHDQEIVFFGGNPRSVSGDVEICLALPSDILKRLLEDPTFLAKPPCSPFDT